MNKIILLFLYILIIVFSFSVEVLFTENGALDDIISVISSAEKSVYLSSYSIDCKEIIDLLNSLNLKGVDVNVIIDDRSISRAFSAGINFNISGDKSSYLEHAKFVVIDEKMVVFGTGNFTYGGLIEDSNSFLVFDNERIAEIFLNFFFSIKNGSSDINLQESGYNFFLLPSGEAKDYILNRILKADESVVFMIYAFTDEDFMTAFKLCESRGINVEGIVDDWNYDSKLYDYFDDNIFINHNEWLVHDKTIIIDDEYIITGSANFSKNGWKRNNEIVLFLKSKALAEEYLKHYNYIKGEILNENRY